MRTVMTNRPVKSHMLVGILRQIPNTVGIGVAVKGGESERSWEFIRHS